LEPEWKPQMEVSEILFCPNPILKSIETSQQQIKVCEDENQIKLKENPIKIDEDKKLNENQIKLKENPIKIDEDKKVNEKPIKIEEDKKINEEPIKIDEDKKLKVDADKKIDNNEKPIKTDEKQISPMIDDFVPLEENLMYFAEIIQDQNLLQG